MKKHYCYICENEELTSENRSSEHIIQNCISGHEECSHLVCHKVNTTIFKSLDDELRDCLIFFRNLGFKIDRRCHPSPVTGVDEEGFPYFIDTKKEGQERHFNPILGLNEQENYFKYPLFREEKSLEWLQKYKGLADEQMEEMKKSRKIIEGGKKIIEIEEKMLAIFWNPLFFRAITKIATNFYMWKGGLKSEITEPIRFIKGESSSNFNMGYFYPKEKLKYQFDDEVSHILYLRGDKQQGILYCYIELFNCHCFIINLNMTYNGDDFHEEYIWDLKNAKRIQKNVRLDIYRHDLVSRNYDFFNTKYDDYKERLMRLNDILKLNLIEIK